MPGRAGGTRGRITGDYEYYEYWEYYEYCKGRGTKPSRRHTLPTGREAVAAERADRM